MRATVEALIDLGLSLHGARAHGLITHDESLAIDEALAKSAGPVTSPEIERILAEAEEWTDVPAEMTALARTLFQMVEELVWGGYQTVLASFTATARGTELRDAL